MSDKKEIICDGCGRPESQCVCPEKHIFSDEALEVARKGAAELDAGKFVTLEELEKRIDAPVLPLLTDEQIREKVYHIFKNDQCSECALSVHLWNGLMTCLNCKGEKIIADLLILNAELAKREARIKELEKESAARAEVINRLTDAGTIQCPECGGSGLVSLSGRASDGPDKCERCYGTGYLSKVAELQAALASAKETTAKKLIKEFTTYLREVLDYDPDTLTAWQALKSKWEVK